MAVLKVIEIMADSKKSWEDATKKGIKRASKSVKNIRSAWVSWVFYKWKRLKN